MGHINKIGKSTINLSLLQRYWTDDISCIIDGWNVTVICQLEVKI